MPRPDGGAPPVPADDCIAAPAGARLARAAAGGAGMRGGETVTFGGSDLDRAAELRARPEAIAAMLADPAARVVPFWRGKPLFRGDGVGWVPPGHALLADAPEPPVFLGRDAAGPRFAADISPWTPAPAADPPDGAADAAEPQHPALAAGDRFADLRGMLARLGARDAECLAMARALTGWHASHGFCAACGARSRPALAGWQRLCDACGAQHFPRTDPVVIMLVTCGEAVLVGRSAEWPEGMYSLLAGFVEPGETIEAAVRREVREEAGVEVGAVGYLASQPWPFPASLMLGCRAEAAARDLRLDPGELEDALWLGRGEAVAVLAGGHPRVRPPRPGSIARFLIEAWVADRLD
jgi:NAD+ diphosphatase